MIIGTTNQEMAISSDFFKQRITLFNKNWDESSQLFEYTVNLVAINGLEVNASTSMFVKINKPPTPGSCGVFPRQGIAFEDKFRIDCWDWTDPEGIGIK